MEIKQIINDVLELPSTIQLLQEKIFGLQNIKLNIEQDIKLIEIEANNVIRNEKTEDGKLKYSNEKLRDNALYASLNMNELYSNLQNNKMNIINKIKLLDIDKEYNENKMRSYRIFADIISTKVK